MSTSLLPNYINGQRLDSQSDEILDVLNPATGEPIAQVPLAPPEEVGQAVSAAQAAFWEWRQTPPVERAGYLFRLKNLMEERREELARTITQENGKTLDEARGEMQRTIENVEVAAGIPSLMMGTNLEDVAPGIDEYAIRQPLGVFAVIAPFNFPGMVPMWFVPYAVACGNTVIVKPSERTPITQNRIFELVDELDLPPGVLNLVNGAKRTVDAMLDHSGIKGVSFVGSTPVARYVYQRGASNGKRVQAQAGAKNFLIVMPDAPLEPTTENIIGSAFGNAGERCLAGAVVLAVGDAYEPVKDRLVESASKIRAGNGLDPDVDMGPVISEEHRQRILDYIEEGIRAGAELLLDGRGVQVEDSPGGHFVGPTIFDRVRPEMKIAQEEIFGPVLGIIPVESLAEALEIIAANRYGNAASIFTASGKAARDFQYHVQCGNVGINVGVAAPMAFFHFGGMKDSFFGDLHGQGTDAIEFFTEKKVVISRWW